METESMTEELLLRLEEHGCKVRIVLAEHLHDLREAIEARHEQGLFDAEFYQECLTEFQFEFPDCLPDTKSLIVIAVPRPQNQVVFTWNGKVWPFMLPPTYVGYEETRERVEALLAGFLAPQGYQAARTALPLKLLAVRSGLGRYGRNNICYVAGMGSFHQLVAFYSDLPCPEDNWQEVQMMESCQDCQACRRHCPTGAIPSDRFLLRAERCLVFHNEKPGDVPFPSWINPAWHNCLVGCLICQRICPQNKDLLSWVEGNEVFSEEETTLILEGVPLAQLPTTTVQKLKRLDLLDSVDILPRNLSALLNQTR